MEIKKIVEGMTAPQVAKVIEDNFNEADQKKADKTELSELKKKVDNLKPSIVTGNVVNNADEEDITSLDNKLKLKDRVSNEGMGYVIIRKHKTFADQVTQPNTIYEIRYEFDLGGEQITIPAECELLFIGGKIKNGSILFQNTHLNGHPLIEADIVSGSFFKNVILEIDWFGAKKDNPNFDNALVFEKMHKIKSNDTGNGFILMLGNGVYYSSSFRVAANATYRGQGGGTILKSVSNGSTYSFGSQTPINNVFIAIQSPRVVIDNFVIDGGGLEGYNTCAVGAYQSGFLFTMKNIIVKNCKVGCFISSADGGFFKIHDCEFYSAGSYCIKFNGVVDSLSVERCNFERWFVNGETNDWNRLANTSVIDLSGKLMKKNITIKGNRYEMIRCKYIYNLGSSVYSVGIEDEMYMIDKNSASTLEYTVNAVVRIESVARNNAVRIIGGSSQITGVLQHYAHIGMSNSLCCLVLDSCPFSHTTNGYYKVINDDGSISDMTSTGKTMVKSILGINTYGFPIDTTNYANVCSGNAKMAGIEFGMQGAQRIIQTGSIEQPLKLGIAGLNNISVEKGYIGFSTPKNGDYVGRIGYSGVNVVSYETGSINISNTLVKDGERDKILRLATVNTKRNVQSSFPLKAVDGYIHFDTNGVPYIYISNGYSIDSSSYDGAYYNIKHLLLPKAGASRPILTSLDSGYCFFDTSLNKPIWWSGSNWVDNTGASV